MRTSSEPERDEDGRWITEADANGKHSDVGVTERLNHLPGRGEHAGAAVAPCTSANVA
jgi:hypothetical protein